MLPMRVEVREEKEVTLPLANFSIMPLVSLFIVMTQKSLALVASAEEPKQMGTCQGPALAK